MQFPASLVRIPAYGSRSSGPHPRVTLSTRRSDGISARAETLSIPITLVILLLAFGALMAAFMPLGLGLIAVLTATSLMAVTSQVFHIDSSASTLVLLIGLAVGVDYSLFYVRRQREERAAGRSNHEAIAIAAATSGRAVLTSGLTVIIAMGAMYLTGQGTFMGMAVGTMLVVAVAVIGSLTLLPALLALLGDRIERGRNPWLGRWLAAQRARGDSRVWSAILRRVLRHPGLAATGAAALLVALAVPALGLKTAVPGATDIPPRCRSSRRTTASCARSRVTHACSGRGEGAQRYDSGHRRLHRFVQARRARDGGHARADHDGGQREPRCRHRERSAHR